MSTFTQSGQAPPSPDGPTDPPSGPAALFVRAQELFGVTVAQVAADAWERPTPCADWRVRDLVGHVLAENLWIPPLLAGSTIAQVGDRLDGDQLGDDPPAAWRSAAVAARTAITRPGAMTDTVHLSFGDVPGSEYTMQLFADHLVHHWDLASAIGVDPALPDDLVAAAITWFAGQESAYRAAGLIGPRPSGAPDGRPGLTGLLAMFGRTAPWTRRPDTMSGTALDVVARFNEAFGAQDIDAVMALMTADCAFENTQPPSGTRYAGQEQVRAAFEEFFGSSPSAGFEAEEITALGDRVVVRWLYRWPGPDGGGHVRGIDLFRIEDHKVAEKLSYVKG